MATNLQFRQLLHLLKTTTSIEAIKEQQRSIAFFLPDTVEMIDFDQRNRAHKYDLWHHCLHTVLNLPRGMDDDMLYLAALLHDIGKPDCQVRGKREDDPNMHYYGHPHRGVEITRDRVIPALAEKGVYLSLDEQRRLIYYVEYHDDRVSLRHEHLRRHLQMASLAEFKNLMQLQVADATAHRMLPVIEMRRRICGTWVDGYADEVYSRVFSQVRDEAKP